MNLRNIIAIVLGLVLAFSTILVLEEFGHQIYPPSQEIVDAQKRLNEASHQDNEEVKAASEAMKQAMKAYLQDAPLGSMLMVMIAWLLGSFFGSFAASGLAKSRRLLLGMVIGIMVCLATLVNLITIPYHPIWMAVSSLVLILPFSYLGAQVGIRLISPKTSSP